MAPKTDEQKAGKSKAEKKPVKKAEKKIKSDSKTDAKKKKSKKSVETYKIYIYKVLKQVLDRDSLFLFEINPMFILCDDGCLRVFSEVVCF